MKSLALSTTIHDVGSSTPSISCTRATAARPPAPEAAIAVVVLQLLARRAPGSQHLLVRGRFVFAESQRQLRQELAFPAAVRLLGAGDGSGAFAADSASVASASSTPSSDEHAASNGDNNRKPATRTRTAMGLNQRDAPVLGLRSQSDVLGRGVGPLVGFADVAPEGGAVLGVAGLFADLLLALPCPAAGGDEPCSHAVAGQADGDPCAFRVAGNDLPDCLRG